MHLWGWLLSLLVFLLRVGSKKRKRKKEIKTGGERRKKRRRKRRRKREEKKVMRKCKTEGGEEEREENGEVRADDGIYTYTCPAGPRATRSRPLKELSHLRTTGRIAGRPAILGRDTYMPSGVKGKGNRCPPLLKPLQWRSRKAQCGFPATA